MGKKMHKAKIKKDTFYIADASRNFWSWIEIRNGSNLFFLIKMSSIIAISKRVYGKIPLTALI